VREEQHVGGREVGIDVTNDASSDALADAGTWRLAGGDLELLDPVPTLLAE
jgi:hypothetical protein